MFPQTMLKITYKRQATKSVSHVTSYFLMRILEYFVLLFAGHNYEILGPKYLCAASARSGECWTTGAEQPIWRHTHEAVIESSRKFAKYLEKASTRAFSC